MQKGLFADELVNEFGLTQRNAMAIVNKFINTIKTELVEEEHCCIPGVGTLRTRVREEYAYDTPFTGKGVCPRCKRVSFKASGKLLEVINKDQ